MGGSSGEQSGTVPLLSVSNRARRTGHPDLITLIYWFACSGAMGTPDPDEGEGEESWRKGIDLCGDAPTVSTVSAMKVGLCGDA